MTADNSGRSDDPVRDRFEGNSQRVDGNDPSRASTLGPLEPTRRRALGSNPAADPITVCYLDDDSTFRDLVGTAFEDDDRLEVRTASSLREATRRIESIDCVVCGNAPGRNEDGTGTGTETERELENRTLETVRERDPDLPVVYFVDECSEAVLAQLCSTRRVDFLQKGADETTVALLGCRIRAVVDRQRRSALARRALVALETVPNGVAIVTPAGTFEFVGRAFAAEFGADRDDLLGRPWHTVYPDEEVDRLRSTALPTVEDGWRWTGRCVGRRADGTTFTARTGIAGLEDGGLVFVLGAPFGSGSGSRSSDGNGA